MSTTSGDFVNSVRETISKKKNSEYRKRTILRDLFDNTIGILKKSGKVEIRNVKDFETNDISYLVSLYLESEDICQEFVSILDKNGIHVTVNRIDQKNSVCLLNFKNKELTGILPDSSCFAELKITGKYFFTLKISLSEITPDYRIYESNYFYVKLWVFDGEGFTNHEVQIRTEDRHKKKMKSLLSPSICLNIFFDEMGEIIDTNISKKRGAKSVS